MLKLKPKRLKQHIEYATVFHGSRNQYGPEAVIEIPEKAIVSDICAGFSELAGDEVITLEARLLLGTGDEEPVYITASGSEGRYLFRCLSIAHLYTAMGGLTYMDDVEEGSVTVDITRITVRARSSAYESHALPVDVYVRYYA
jgi:hypothetical protein